MIDTPQSILLSSTLSQRTGDKQRPSTILMIGQMWGEWRIWQQQTVNVQLSQTDNNTYRSKTDVLGAIATNAAWIGNVSED